MKSRVADKWQREGLFFSIIRHDVDEDNHYYNAIVRFPFPVMIDRGPLILEYGILSTINLPMFGRVTMVADRSDVKKWGDKAGWLYGFTVNPDNHPYISDTNLLCVKEELEYLAMLIMYASQFEVEYANAKTLQARRAVATRIRMKFAETKPMLFWENSTPKEIA